MLDLDERITNGLRELASRAPADADVWPAAEAHVGRRRRRRHTMAAGAVIVALIAGVGVIAGVAGHGGSTGGVEKPGPTSAPRTVVPLAAKGPSKGTLTITAGRNGRLTFSPDSLRATTGVYRIRLVNASATQTNLVFDKAAVRFRGLTLNQRGQTLSARAFFGTPGKYTFFCSLSGHRAAGQQGVVHVTGKALPPSAAGR